MSLLLPSILAPLILKSSILVAFLPVLYSISVHGFLSFFHERHFFTLRHWVPISERVLFLLAFLLQARVIGYLVPWDYQKDDLCSYERQHDIPRQCRSGQRPHATVEEIVPFILTVTFTSFSIAFSAWLIKQTRRNEINGPSPPYPAKSQHSPNAKMERVNKRSMNNAANDNINSMKNKVVLITGANGGIGLETARQLVHRGATVILACRSEERGERAVADIQASLDKLHKNGGREETSGSMHLLLLDLTSHASVHQAVETFLKWNMPLNVLINNAGVMMSQRVETQDGLEYTMAANHLGHFLLTNLLLPKLRQTALKQRSPAKVITVSSSLYTKACRLDTSINQSKALITAKSCTSEGIRKYSFFRTAARNLTPGLDLNDLQCRHKPYRLFEQYAQSKLANILFARELGRREKLRARKLKIVGTSRRDVERNLDEREKNMKTEETQCSSTGRTYLPQSVIDSTSSLSASASSSKKSSSDCSPTPSNTPITPSNEMNNTINDNCTTNTDTTEANELMKIDTKINHDAVSNAVYPVLSYALHPGLVRTDVVRDLPWYLYYPNNIFACFLALLQKTPTSGAYTSVFCAVMNDDYGWWNKRDDDDGGTCDDDGRRRVDYDDDIYFVNSCRYPLENLALNNEDAEKLWELSCQLVSMPLIKLR